MVDTVRMGYISNGIYHRPNKQFATILVLEANLGCRIGDILNLTTESIIKDGMFWKLNIIEEKTNKKRTFIVPESVKAFIDDYCYEEGIYSGKIFKCGKQATWKNMRYICEYLNLDDTSTHSLRKMKAEKLYEESGHDIELVCEFLQHSGINTTRNYLKRSDAQLEKAISQTVTLA
jgi:site-specific recombinase XerD